MDDRLIRVAVVEPFVILRAGLEVILRDASGIELVGTATCRAEAIALCSRTSPDIVITSLYLPEMDATVFIRSLLETDPSTGIVVLTNEHEAVRVEEAFAGGALGFILMCATESELVNAIHAVHHGEPALSPQAAQMLIQATMRSHHNQRHRLSRREIEVLSLMVEGWNNAAIAEYLLVSPYTVKNHVSSILGKLGVNSRTAAVVTALKENLLEKLNFDPSGAASKKKAAARAAADHFMLSPGPQVTITEFSPP
jgi:DNA-binding NarL/FixJ family response regulator